MRSEDEAKLKTSVEDTRKMEQIRPDTYDIIIGKNPTS